MHFEFLIEDISGKKMLDFLLTKILGQDNSFNVHHYKGIGHIPKNINKKVDASKRILLANLPRLLRGYGNTFRGYGKDYQAYLFIICDLDNKCLKEFRKDLFKILDSINPKPDTSFCIAIEEGEAWLLGDKKAILTAYPDAKKDILNAYQNDSICGTWETLADSVYRGGVSGLSAKGWSEVGAMKSKWAENIAPNMDINNNSSPSFNYFLQKIKEKII